MAYRIEKENQSGRQALVIDGFEKGIADSPYEGIMSMKNVNISYLKGSTYVNYKRQRINTAGGSTTFTAQTSPSQLNYSGLTLNVGDAVTVSSSGTLPNPLAANTTYFVQARTSTTFQLATSLGGSAITITTTGTGTHTVTLITMGEPIFSAIATNSSDLNARTYILDDVGRVWQDSGTQTGTSFPYFVLLAGNKSNAAGGDGTGLAYYKDYLFVFREDGLEVCGNGTGTGGVNSSNWADTNSTGFFMPDNTVVDITPPSAGDTVIQMDDPWPFPTGTFEVSFGTQQVVSGDFVNGVDTFNITPALNDNFADNEATVEFLESTSGTGDNMALAATDDILYFCNRDRVGAISAAPDQIFDVEDFETTRLNYNALALPQYEKAVWLEQLSVNLMVIGRNFIYPWDRTSTSYNIPLPINEEMSKVINILNTLYILAGEKGNIYSSNGYSISLYKKIPDSFTNSIDPTWSWGGFMFHRNRLFFGAYSQTMDSDEESGIFSIDLNSENAILNFESQGSTGLVPSGSASAVNILIDLNNDLSNTSTYSPDRYYSAYENNGIGVVDYNDDTPWTNFEAVIETDLIPVGTFLEKRTFQDVEYKLDKPLASGDQIRLSFRTNLNESYTVIGTTSGSTNQVISESFSSNVNEAEWLQFKIELDCASSNSSFNRLREMRIH